MNPLSSGDITEDYRLNTIRKRMSCIKDIVAVMSPKGGVGKTIIAVSTSLILAEEGYVVGLLDLDVTNPTAHIMLGLKPSINIIREERGVIPPRIHGVWFMTPAIFSGSGPIPLRGMGISNLIREILMITRWPSLDYLIIDTPPGIADEIMDLFFIAPGAKALLVTTCSIASVMSVERAINILKDANIKIIGLIENMAQTPSNHAIKLCIESGVKYLGNIPYDPRLEQSVGSIDKLKRTLFYNTLKDVIRDLIRCTS